MANRLEESIARIQTLDRRLTQSAMSAFNKCWSKKIPLYIIWGYRSPEEQDLLFRYSRSAPGNTITNRRGGYSPHNYGLALDFCLIQDNAILGWDDIYDDRYWRWKWIKAIKVFEEEGWESGYRFPSFEPGHMQNLLNQNLGDLYIKYEQSKVGDNRLPFI